jgi:hypothetical protein
LQAHITYTSEKVIEDAGEHKTYEEQVIAENESLRFEIQQLKQYHSRREQEWLHQLEDTNVAHKNKLDSLTKEHNDTVNTLTNETQQRIERLQRENHEKLTQVN